MSFTPKNPNPLTLILIPSALVAGVTLFLGLVIFMILDKSGLSENPDGSSIRALLHVFVVIYITSTGMALVIPKMIKGKEGQDPVKTVLNRTLVKYALLEGSTLFGILILLIAHTKGLAQTSALPYIGLLGYATMLLVYIFDLPKLIAITKNEEDAIEHPMN